MSKPDLMACQRCKRRVGKLQPTDGDAAMLFAAAAHAELDGVYLCGSCTKTLEAMAIRVAGPTRASAARLRGSGPGEGPVGP
jgi:DNA-directed RNA polymerase subunit RPC12/RpoP